MVSRLNEIQVATSAIDRFAYCNLEGGDCRRICDLLSLEFSPNELKRQKNRLQGIAELMSEDGGRSTDEQQSLPFLGAMRFKNSNSVAAYFL